MSGSRATVPAIAVAFALAFAGCGATKQEESSTPATSTSSEGTVATSTTPSQATTGVVTTTPVQPQSEAVGAGAITAELSRPFSAASPWNMRVDRQPADPNSGRLILLARQRKEVEYAGGAAPRVRTRTISSGLFINTRRWTDTIVDGAEGVPTSVVCRQQIAYCGDGKDVTMLNIPVDAAPQPQFDGWFTVIDRAAGVAYDLWRARRSVDRQVVSYQFMRKWSLNGLGFQAPDNVSARGSGLPLFAGVILPSEVEAGTIEHALAISVPGPARGRYVQPASSTDGVGSERSLPEGAHIRLRLGVRLGRLSTGTNARGARAILRALKTYGAIVVDRARVPTLYGQLNGNWQTRLRNRAGELIYGNGRRLPGALQRRPGVGVPLLRGNEVQSLRLNDFEVVKLPPEFSYPPLNAPAGTTQPGAP